MSVINIADYNLEDSYGRAQLIADAPSGVYFFTDTDGNEVSVAITRYASMTKNVTYASNPNWVEVSSYDKCGWLQDIKHIPKNPDLSGWVAKQALLAFIASHFEDIKKEEVPSSSYEAETHRKLELNVLSSLFRKIAENELEPTHEVDLLKFIEENL